MLFQIDLDRYFGFSDSSNQLQELKLSSVGTLTTSLNASLVSSDGRSNGVGRGRNCSLVSLLSPPHWDTCSYH